MEGLSMFNNRCFPGAGIGCLFITSNVSVQTYFAKRRSLAFSIAVTGTAVGVFSFPQLTRLLIDNFAWQGAVLVYGMCIVSIRYKYVSLRLLIRSVHTERSVTVPVTSTGKMGITVSVKRSKVPPVNVKVHSQRTTPSPSASP